MSPPERQMNGVVTSWLVPLWRRCLEFVRTSTKCCLTLQNSVTIIQNRNKTQHLEVVTDKSSLFRESPWPISTRAIFGEISAVKSGIYIYIYRVCITPPRSLAIMYMVYFGLDITPVRKRYRIYSQVCASGTRLSPPRSLQGVRGTLVLRLVTKCFGSSYFELRCFSAIFTLP